MRKSWWKILSIVLLVYAIVGGLLLPVPALRQLQETVRNLYYHVSMWFAMMILFTISLVHSIRYLRTTNFKYDICARDYSAVAIVLGLLGYATGVIWASYTWADPNNPAYASFGSIVREPKLIGTAIALLTYFAYFVLRSSITDIDKRARVSAVYNIFAYAMLFPSIWIIPRLLPSLHPGQEGNPALDFRDVDTRLRMVFWPAVAGWTLLAVWIATLKVRIDFLKEKKWLHAK
ncbi:ABC transporter permease [Pollutibacter soli]|jgi:heme exporter protein C|uniref:ABC transporter permease n=1 Tax=Pollutibacter soli TaxID=3034157 RepID=UPI0030135132